MIEGVHGCAGKKVEGGWGVDILVAWGVLVVQREAAKDAKSNNGPDNNSNDAINQLV